MKNLVLKPRVSEKSYGQSQTLRTYVFDVPMNVNKQTVAAAVAAQFEVTVEAVNTAIIKGKSKRTFKKGGRPIAGKQKDVKKAYVVLKEGDSLPVYAALQQEEEKAAKAKEKK